MTAPQCCYVPGIWLSTPETRWHTLLMWRGQRVDISTVCPRPGEAGGRSGQGQFGVGRTGLLSEERASQERDGQQEELAGRRRGPACIERSMSFSRGVDVHLTRNERTIVEGVLLGGQQRAAQAGPCKAFCTRVSH